jgi:hypothetical protein
MRALVGLGCLSHREKKLVEVAHLGLSWSPLLIRKVKLCASAFSQACRSELDRMLQLFPLPLLDGVLA